MDNGAICIIFRWQMATLGALVEIIAHAEGIDRERVAAIARAVREAGLIATHGRGPSAAQMSETDAANLLIAVNGAETARAAPQAVRRFRALRTNHKNQREFGSVLEEIIAAAVRLELVEYLHRLYLPTVDANRSKRRVASGTFDMKIEFEFNRPMAVIECRIPATAMPMHLPFYPQKSTVRAESDRRTTIGHRTILAVAEMMRR
jgi:hypothetical protein